MAPFGRGEKPSSPKREGSLACQSAVTPEGATLRCAGPVQRSRTVGSCRPRSDGYADPPARQSRDHLAKQRAAQTLFDLYLTSPAQLAASLGYVVTNISRRTRHLET